MLGFRAVGEGQSLGEISLLVSSRFRVSGAFRAESSVRHPDESRDPVLVVSPERSAPSYHRMMDAHAPLPWNILSRGSRLSSG